MTIPGEQMFASDQLQVGSGQDALQNVLYEALNGVELNPESLYEAQLFNRIGTSPPAFRQSDVSGK